MVTLLLLIACGTQTGPGQAPVEAGDDNPATTPVIQPTLGTAANPGSSPDAPAAQMGALPLLIRASLDLRGVRPTEAELEAVEADPAAVDGLIDGFVYADTFGSQVRNLWSPIYMTRLDYFSIAASAYGLDDAAGFAASVGEEPLEILSTIAENDLPYTDLVTADWTMANELLGAAWPLDYPAGTTGWQQAHYTDDRPAAGILTANGMWWRYNTTYSNANRGRANAVSKVLLCTDYLSKPIEFDRNVNLLDGDAVNDALKSNEGCLACHHSLDPLAAYFWGFYHADIYNKTDMSIYHPEREYLYGIATGTSPGYYGEPGYTLHDLGQQIAADSRYPQCFVQQAFQQLVGRDVALSDTATLSDLRDEFLANGLTIRPLLLDVVAGDDYRAGVSEGGAPAWRKRMTPEVLASALEDLTGYRFTYAGYDMLTTDTYGLRTLDGGVDGEFVTSAAKETTATMVLAEERVTQAAAAYVVANDKLDPANARLFTHVHFVETPATDPDAMVAQIQDLHFRLYGHRVDADGQEVAANLELWQSLYDADGDITAAWSGLLSVLLRDPDFLFY